MYIIIKGKVLWNKIHISGVQFMLNYVLIKPEIFTDIYWMVTSEFIQGSTYKPSDSNNNNHLTFWFHFWILFLFDDPDSKYVSNVWKNTLIVVHLKEKDCQEMKKATIS